MSYTSRFECIDKWITHCDEIQNNGTMPKVIDNTYAGVLCVLIVTMLELCIKDIFAEFAKKKHKVFNVFVENHFSRINGHIQLHDLTQKHVRCFGQRYVDLFNRMIDNEEKLAITQGHSVKTAYNNLITWRHTFVHAPKFPPTTYIEVKAAYDLSKKVLTCLELAFIK